MLNFFKESAIRQLLLKQCCKVRTGSAALLDMIEISWSYGVADEAVLFNTDEMGWKSEA